MTENTREIMTLLNAQVSAAIEKAQRLDKSGQDSKSEWAEASSLEDRLSEISLLSEGERNIAMRGAVRAALKAGNYTLAEFYVNKYRADPRTSSNLSSDVTLMLSDYIKQSKCLSSDWCNRNF